MALPALRSVGNPAFDLYVNDAGGDDPVASFSWPIVEQETLGFAPVQLSVDGIELQSLTNTIRVENMSPVIDNRAHEVQWDFFSFQYDQFLVVQNGALEFVVTDEEAATAGIWQFNVIDPAEYPGGAYVLDTTDPRAPVLLTDARRQHA